MSDYGRTLLVVLFFAVFAACNNGPAEEVKSDTVKEADSVKPAQSTRSNMSFLNDYNAIEQVCGNENWLLANGKDSSYLYFSRLGPYTYNTYDYRLNKGDSSNVVHGNIVRDGDNLVWQFSGKKVYVITASSARVVWAVEGTDSLRYEFVRLNDRQMSITYPDKRSYILQKTIPFSLFLVRSRYDFAHGTHLAFDAGKAQVKK